MPTDTTTSAQDNQSVEVWLSNASPKHTTIPAHGNSVVTALVLDAPQNRVISASDDHTIHLYTLSTGQLERKLEGHFGGIWCLALASGHGETGSEAPDLLLSGSTDHTIRIWSLNDGKCLHVFGGHTGTVRVLQVVVPEWIEVPDEGGVVKKELCPERPIIVSGGRDNTLRIWTLPRNGEPEHRDEVSDNVNEANIDVENNPYHLLHLEGHEGAIRALAARGRTAVSGSYDNTVRVWDIISGELKHTLVGHKQKVYCVAYDPSRTQAYSGSMDNDIRIWSTTSGECLHTLVGHASLVGLIALSPSYLVSGSADATLRVWDASTGALRHVLAQHKGAITTFHHDETKVISGSNGHLKIWDIKTGAMVRELLDGVDGAWQVASEGQWCVSASTRSNETYIDIWDFGNTDNA